MNQWTCSLYIACPIDCAVIARLAVRSWLLALDWADQAPLSAVHARQLIGRIERIHLALVQILVAPIHRVDIPHIHHCPVEAL